MSLKIEILHSALNKKDFYCGKPMLDNYIRTQAGQDMKRKLCVVFALSDGEVIQGYYTLSNASVPALAVPEPIRRKMPNAYEHLPVTLLGRLAVDQKFKGRGLGSIMLIDALKRSYDISLTSIGSIGVVVDSLDDEAITFYQKFGFILLPDSGKMFIADE